MKLLAWEVFNKKNICTYNQLPDGSLVLCDCYSLKIKVNKLCIQSEKTIP